MHLLLADTTLLELGCQRIEPILPCSKELVLSYFPSACSAFDARVIALARLPRVRFNNLE